MHVIPPEILVRERSATVTFPLDLGNQVIYL